MKTSFSYQSRTPPNEKSSRKNTTMNLSQDSVGSSKARKATTSSYNWTERRHAGYGTLNARGSTGRDSNHSSSAGTSFGPRPTADFSDLPSAPAFGTGSEFNYHGTRSGAPSMSGAGSMPPPHQPPFGRQVIYYSSTIVQSKTSFILYDELSYAFMFLRKNKCYAL